MTAYLDHALAGRTRTAVAVALELVDRGMSAQSVVSDVLAPAQHEVGRRWEANLLSLADEHLASGAAEAALQALAMAQPRPRETRACVTLACAEGDWHSLAAHMLALQLEDAGLCVTFLGASTPAAVVGSVLTRNPPHALIVSITMPTYFAGVTSLANAAHAVGLPVLVGGRALTASGPEHARRLGADGWAGDCADAVATIVRWRSHPPLVPRAATTLPAGALMLHRDAHRLAVLADQARGGRAAPQQDESRRDGLRVDDLRLLLQFLAAAWMVESDDLFLDFLTWIERVLVSRGLPPGELRTELEGLAELLPALPADAVALLQRAATTLPRETGRMSCSP